MTKAPTRGWRSIHVSDGDHPYMKAWWVPGLQIGYEHTFVHQVADFLAGLRTGEKRVPDFRDGLAADAVVDAVLRSATFAALGARRGGFCNGQAGGHRLGDSRRAVRCPSAAAIQSSRRTTGR